MQHEQHMVAMKKKGRKPISFKRGALHEQLGVPAGEPIPAGKKGAALRGEYGPLAKKRAVFGFRGPLAAGRKKRSKRTRKMVQAFGG